ncbi:flagellin [Selenomonas bovis]|uniref:Flagellin n=1 Tax=Selenomonas bovis TaxID=416586 RepID=A0A848B6K2_9FIRM|nr:flagellin [Selenomonas bovis]NMD99096.1 flagellin [Selenomonas bovis]
MAMVVKNNMSAVSTLNTLNKNSAALAKSLQKVSSGMKINSAADDASGYAISERMRVQIRGLDQANQNTQNGSSMMKVAEGAVSSTVDILKTLKEKAINAANDTNTDSDRQTIQKELNQSIDQIDDNANVTYNGKYLVDGSKNSAGNATFTALSNESLGKDTKASDKLTALTKRNGDALEIQSTDYVTVSYVQGGKTYSTQFQVGDKTLQDVFNAAEDIDKDSKIFADAKNASVMKAMGIADVTAAQKKMDDADTAAYGAKVQAKIADGSLELSAAINGTDGKGADLDGAAKTAVDAVTADVVKGIAAYNDAQTDASKKIDTAALKDYGTFDKTAGALKTGLTNQQKLDFIAALKKDANYESLAADNTNGKAAKDAVTAYDTFMTAKAASDNAHIAVVDSKTIGLAASNDKVETADGEKAITITANAPGIKGQIAGFNISVTDSEGNTRKSINAALDDWRETIRAQNKSDDNAVSFQVGTNANQNIKVGLTDMRSEALGLKGADGTKLNISTQNKANAAVNVLDNALQKALDQQTTIGSVESRLSYTSSNLTTASENVQSSESTIRDADMAKEMTEYTKNNVLLQAAQSMLAQANQSSSSVLSLLQ